jgi:DNA invertase Pin-like site-specific DNA recombinase
MTTKTAAVYLRVSTSDQTVANQTDEVTQLARARGFEPVIYAETGSAVKARPVLDRMLSDVRAGRINAVAVWSLDRLGRGFACFDLYRDLAHMNVRLLSVREPWTDTEGPTRDLLVAVMSWVSGFERQRLIERVNAGLTRARKEGKTLGRPKASPVKVAAAVERVRGGMTEREAANASGVSRSPLQRALAA